MKFTIAKEQMLTGLQAVQSIVGSRTTLPILSNVLLKTGEGVLELTATDLDVTITCAVPAEVHKAGLTTLPVRKLFGIVREMGMGDLDFEVDEKNRCSLRMGPSFYKIHGLAGEEFPPVPQFKEEGKVVVEQKKMKTLLRRTCFAASTEEARYVLNGIFLSLKEHKLTMVATDGRRLALAEEELEGSGKAQAEFIIPNKAVNELGRLLGESGTVEIFYTENQAGFQMVNEGATAPVRVVTKLIEGNYPNYRMVIPAETKERIQLEREEFLHALRRAEIVTSDKQNSVKLCFGKNTLTITANTPDVGEGTENIAIKYEGEEMAIAFNPGFIIQPLNALDDQQDIFLEFTNDMSPGLLKINGPFLYVVMPMRLQ